MNIILHTPIDFRDILRQKMKDNRISQRKIAALTGIRPDRDTICMSSYREVYRDDKGYLVMRWWSFPDTTTRIKNTDTLKYRMVYDNTNTSCGIQRSVYYYHARSYMAGDTLIESGTVEHRYYYEGRMVKHLFGDWRSEARYVDRLTPMKPR